MNTTFESKCDESILELSKEDLQTELSRLRTVYNNAQQSIDEKNQQLYSLKLQNDVLQASKLDYQQEFEQLSSDESKKRKALQDRIQVLELNNANEKIIHSEQLQGIQHELEIVKKKCAELEAVPVATVSLAEFDALSVKCTNLEEVCKSNASIWIHKGNEYSNFKKQMQESEASWNEERHCYIANSAEAKRKVAELEEELASLHAELATARVGPKLEDGDEPEGHAARGNSMFCELFDKWKQMKRKWEEVTVAYDAGRRERATLRNQNAALRRDNANMAERWQSDGVEARRDDADLIHNYEGSNTVLQNSIKRLEDELAKERKANYDKLTRESDNIYMGMIKERNEQIDKMNHEVSMAACNRVIHAREVRQANSASRQYRAEAAQFRQQLELVSAQLVQLQEEQSRQGDASDDGASGNSADGANSDRTQTIKGSVEGNSALQQRGIRDATTMTVDRSWGSTVCKAPIATFGKQKQPLNPQSPDTESTKPLPNSVSPITTNEINNVEELSKDPVTMEADKENALPSGPSHNPPKKTVQFAEDVRNSPTVPQRRRIRPKGKPIDCSNAVVVKMIFDT